MAKKIKMYKSHHIHDRKRQAPKSQKVDQSRSSDPSNWPITHTAPAAQKRITATDYDDQ